MINSESRIDLHIHTTASDGTWDLKTLLKKLEYHEVSIFSITDHDSIKSSVEMISMQRPEDKTFIIGAEISCSYNDKEYHLTSYSFDYNDQDFLDLLQYNQKQREDYNQKIVNFAASFNPGISLADYLQYQHPTGRGGWSSLNYLIDRKVIKSIRDFFVLAGKCQDRMTFKGPEEVIEIVKSAGGYPFLAHPNAYNNGKLLAVETLREWQLMGIVGIECYSPYLSNLEEAKYYLGFCQEHQLMTSGGSDCHGDFTGRRLGSPVVRLKQLNLDFI